MTRRSRQQLVLPRLSSLQPPSLSSQSSTPPLRPTSYSSSFSPPISKTPPLDDAVIAGLGLGHNNPDLPSSNGKASGSMILYRLTSDPRKSYQSLVSEAGSNSFLLPPYLKHRSSFADSTLTLTNSKPTSALRGLVPYLYDPSLDLSQPIDDEDRLHDPTIKEDFRSKKESFSWRGVSNLTVLLVLILVLLCLFIFYPVWTFVRDRARNLSIYGNTRINGTG